MSNPSGRRVLVVEDDPVQQDIIRASLESAGLQVDATASAAEALKLFEARRPDLILIDVGLPDGNGVELCRALNGREPAAPKLLLTARGDLRTRLAGFANGAKDYIQKPFAAQELLARVNVHLDIKSSLEELSRRNEDLKLRERARQDMTDMILHDLRIPLTSIMGTIETIRSRGLLSKKDYRRFAPLLESADTATEFMLLMLNDLLDVSQAETTGGLNTTIDEIDLPQMIDRLKKLFAGRLQAKRLQLRPELRGLQRARTDRQLLFRMLVNIVSNAVSYSPVDADVEIHGARVGSALRLSVLDRGPGVPEPEREKIFSKFSTHVDSEKDPGKGLGLTFCRLAARALKGRAWHEPRPGGGSSFSLEIPGAA